MTNSRSVCGERQLMDTVDQSIDIYICLLCKGFFEVSWLANSSTALVTKQC